MSKLTAQLVVILFCWIIYPYKLVKHFAFIRKKNKAIKQADKLQKTTDKKIMVVQLGSIFKVGTNTELKRMDKLARTILKIKRADNWIWDYKKALIYSAK
jgi:hypothetical protein